MEERAAEGRFVLPARRLAAGAERCAQVQEGGHQSLRRTGRADGAALAELKKCGMPVICSQDAVTLAHKDDPIIVAWMHGDEPDNAQTMPGGKGCGPPDIAGEDPCGIRSVPQGGHSRPVFLNLGRCAAWDTLPDRGVGRMHDEEYVECVKGCDIASFDIYPVAQDDEVKNKLDWVGQGVERLIKSPADANRSGTASNARGLRRRQGQPEAGQGGGLDRARAREPRDHLFLPRIQAQRATITRCSTIRKFSRR